MTRFVILSLACGMLAACGGGTERRAVENASTNMAARIWTEPGVARAINVSGSMVADFKPGADILLQAIPMPLGMARYGEFDTFTMIIYDTRGATHGQVLKGMRAYCAGLGRPLVQPEHGVMRSEGGAPAWGWASARCA
jgi:hypothetical protein